MVSHLDRRYTPFFFSFSSSLHLFISFSFYSSLHFLPPYFSASTMARYPMSDVHTLLFTLIYLEIWWPPVTRYGGTLCRFIFFTIYTICDGGMQISFHLYVISITVASLTQNRLVLSPLQNPMSSPVSLVQSRTPSTKALAIPLFLDLPSEGPRPVGLARSPVAYSEPMLGNTFSPALKLTNRANGTSQTHRPKYEATSEKEGISS
jgi:hypothetical protein